MFKFRIPQFKCPALPILARKDSVFFGVCRGLAECTHVPVIAVRVLAVLLLASTAPFALVLYIAGAVVIRFEKKRREWRDRRLGLLRKPSLVLQPGLNRRLGLPGARNDRA